jgi:hypothetical protein
MNMGTTLAVYASICRETGRPFVFPGSAVQWNGLTDMTDARLLARHLEWASTTQAARNEAFNVVNGDVFRWNWMWPRLAHWFGIEAAPFPQQTRPLERQLEGAEAVWAEIAKRYDLAEPDLNVLASAWHTDADLGRPIEVVTDMSKSRRLFGVSGNGRFLQRSLHAAPRRAAYPMNRCSPTEYEPARTGGRTRRQGS